MHHAAFAALGLRGWSYQLLPVPPELFAETVRALPAAGFVGANATLPHKRAALEVADTASDAAREIGAANTLSFLPDGTIEAENTDAPGLLLALGPQPAGRRAMVLGAGGTARAAAWALRNAGIEVAIWNRTPQRARELARDLGVEAVERPCVADLLVNTTTVGMDKCTSDAAALTTLGLTADVLGGYAQIVDFVYSAAPTPLMSVARARAVPTVDGARILAAQGALSFERWTGCVAPLDVMGVAAEGVPDG
jgi:shikimate dehydrogenase